MEVWQGSVRGGPFLSERVKSGDGLLLCLQVKRKTGPISWRPQSFQLKPAPLGRVISHQFLLSLSKRTEPFFYWEDGRCDGDYWVFWLGMSWRRGWGGGGGDLACPSWKNIPEFSVFSLASPEKVQLILFFKFIHYTSPVQVLTSPKESFFC